MCERSNNTITCFTASGATGREASSPLNGSGESSTVSNWDAYNNCQTPQKRLLRRTNHPETRENIPLIPNCADEIKNVKLFCCKRGHAMSKSDSVHTNSLDCQHRWKGALRGAGALSFASPGALSNHMIPVIIQSHTWLRRDGESGAGSDSRQALVP